LETVLKNRVTDRVSGSDPVTRFQCCCAPNDKCYADCFYTSDSSDPYFDPPLLLTTVPGDKCVAGIAVLDAHLYVVRSQTSHVEQYEAVHPAAFRPVRSVAVRGLRQPTDMVASQTATVLFIADATGYVLVVDTTGNVHSRIQVTIYLFIVKPCQSGCEVRLGLPW